MAGEAVVMLDTRPVHGEEAFLAGVREAAASLPAPFGPLDGRRVEGRG